MNVQDIIPVATQNAIAAGLTDAFRSTLKMPKKMNRYFIAKCFDRLILNHEPLDDIRGLVPAEREYLRAVLAEFNAWKASTQPEKE
jgi:hypothetical protein